MREGLKRFYEAIVLWIDWHGRITTLIAILIAFSGTVLVNRVLVIWGTVNGVYLYVVSCLVLALFLATIVVIGRGIEARQRKAIPVTPIASVEHGKPEATKRKPNLSMHAHQYPLVKRDVNDIWHDSWEDHSSRALLFHFKNDPYDDDLTGTPALELRAQVWWMIAVVTEEMHGSD